MSWATLDGYVVIRGTDKAVLVRKGTSDTWIPRSLILEGDMLGIGDIDIVVAEWFSEGEGLDVDELA